MALYIPRSIFHLAGLLYVRPETFGPTLLFVTEKIFWTTVLPESIDCSLLSDP
jgi:hypothetical protein